MRWPRSCRARCARSATNAPGGQAMKLGYVLDDLFAEHRAPSGHPERPARAEAVGDALKAAGIAAYTHVTTRAATDDELARVHSAKYLDDLLKIVPGHTGWLDPDTYY